MPSYGTLAQMMINVGVNLGPLGAGLSKATGQLSSFNAIGSQVASGMTSSFGKTAVAVAAISGAVYAMSQAFAGAINAADEFRLATINIAATMTDWMIGGKEEKRAAFTDHLVYAQEMYKVLELEAYKHFASGKDMQLAWTILTQKGVQLRYDEVNALGMVVDKIKLATQGQISTIQIAQEIRSLLNGQARTTDQIALLLKDKYGKAWKDIVNDHRKAGDLLQWLAEEWEGLAAAQEKIENTLEAQSTNLWTMIRRVGREGLGGAYQYIVDVLKDINTYLMEQEGVISSGIQAAWLAMEPAISAIGLALQAMLSYLWENGEAIGAMVRSISDVIVWVLEATQAVAAWVAEHKLLVLAVLSVIMAYKGAVILGVIIASITAAFATATAAANAFAVSLGYASIAAMGLTACIPVIGIIVAVLGAAALAAYGLGQNLDAVLEKQKAVQYGASRLSPEKVREEFQDRIRYSPSKMVELASKGAVIPTERGEQEVQQQINKVRELDTAIEILGKTKEKKQQTDAVANTMMGEYSVNVDSAAGTVKKLHEVESARNQELEKARKLAKEKGFFIDETKKGEYRLPSALGYEDLTFSRRQQEEAIKNSLEGKKYSERPDDEGKGAKGKGPERLSDWPAIKAERDAKLQLLKNELNAIEKNNELEKASNDNKYAQGILSGTQYAQAILDMEERSYQARVKIIQQEIANEKEAYAFRKANIESEVERGALSPDKAKIELRKALAEHTKTLTIREKEMFDAGIEKTKALTEATKDLIAARKSIVDISASLFQKITGGPLTEQAKQLLSIRLEFVELARQIDKLKINADGKLEIDPALEKSANYMIEAGRLLNADWAEPLAQAVRELAEARTGAEASVAQQKIKEILPQAQKTVEFDVKYKSQIDSFVNDITNGISSIVDAMMDGGKDLKKAANNMFRAIFKDAMKPGLDFLKETLTKGFEDLFGEVGGEVASAIMGVIGIIGMMFTSGKGEKSFSAAGVQSGVTSTEPVRGIIAGPTSIPIAQISVSIREAFANSESYLAEIAENTRGIRGGISGGGTNLNISMLVSEIKSSITGVMDQYFKDYLLTQAALR